MAKIMGNKKAYMILAPLLIMVLTISLTFWRTADYPRASGIMISDGAFLIEEAKQLDGQKVIFEGEVIGDIMPRGDHDWINVLSNGTAIGIWVTREQGQEIGLAGRYQIQGDKVRIIGQFNKACAEHGGDLDIHAISLEIVEPGMVSRQPAELKKILIAGVLLVLAVGSLAYFVFTTFDRKNR
jgi:hypothetical protein